MLIALKELVQYFFVKTKPKDLKKKNSIMKIKYKVLKKLYA